MNAVRIKLTPKQTKRLNRLVAEADKIKKDWFIIGQATSLDNGKFKVQFILLTGEDAYNLSDAANEIEGNKNASPRLAHHTL